MGATFSMIKTVNTDDDILAADWMAEFQNILNNLDPTGIDDESANDAAARATSDPYAGSSLVKATSLEEEIQQLRYLIKQITGEAQWYIDPDTSLANIGAMAQKIIEIGDWNMDTDNTVDVAHGLTLASIRSISAVIRNDYDDGCDPLVGLNTWGYIEVEAVNVRLGRTLGGRFDGIGWDSTSYNRGWITIWYVT